MTFRGYARRVDANLKMVVKAFRDLGCRVHVTNGDWDATVQLGGITMLVEVKDGNKPPSRIKKTPAQEKLHEHMMIRMVKDLDDVAETVCTLKKWNMALIAK